MTKLVDQVKEKKASAVFIENITNPRLIEQIAKETGLKVGAATAVIINELGAIPIDHGPVRSSLETYFQTATGCICGTATSDIRVSLHEPHGRRSPQPGGSDRAGHADKADQ